MEVANELLWLCLLTLHGGAIPGTYRRTGDPGVGSWGGQFGGGCVCVNTNQHSAPETGEKRIFYITHMLLFSNSPLLVLGLERAEEEISEKP